MGKPRFTEEFKIDAIKQITERGYSVADVSRRLGVRVLSQSLAFVFLSIKFCDMLVEKPTGRIFIMTIDFKGSHYPKDVILYAVFFYVRYGVSYRDLEEIMAERGVQVDHATLNRWVVKYSSDIARTAQLRKQPTAGSWRMDETYIKVKGRWVYFYRAVDKYGQTLDFMLSAHRDRAAAILFFKHAIASNGVPEKVVIDKSSANLAGLQRINIGLKFAQTHRPIEILRVKYLNNIIEQDHRFIKNLTRPMLGLKAFHSAVTTLTGIEVAHMIRKQQFLSNHTSPFKQSASLAA